MKNRDNAPIGHTCSLIDSILSRLHDLYSSGESMNGGEYASIEKDIEKVRGANSTLRDWGNEMNNKADDYESELDDLRNQLPRLEEEINDLRTELKELNKQIQE